MNQETMDMEWIGTGSGLNMTLGNTSCIVKGNQGRTLLIDCGYSVTPKLIAQGKFNEITDIVITHQHADHMGGLEGFGFMSYYALNNRESKRPHLHLATTELAESLWEHSLQGGMEQAQTDNNVYFKATLDTYFQVHIGKNISIPGIVTANLLETVHVQHMDAYGIRFENGIFYSGDTVRLPPTDAKIIFQDVQFFESPSDVHISYNCLKRELPDQVKAKTYLVHLGGGWDKIDCKADGFAGYVMPGDKFSFGK